MPTNILIANGGKICFCVSASLSPVDPATDWRAGESVTNVLLTLSGLANNTGRQSTKVDLGATRARRYALFGCVDYTGETPVSGNTVDYWWAPSSSGTDANANVAGNSGVDGAAGDGSVLTGITLDEFLAMCKFIGSLTTTDNGAVQNARIGTFEPEERYGQLIVVNKGGVAFEADDIEAHQVLVPLIDQIQ